MTYQISSFRRFPTAFAIVGAAALAFSGLIASTTPAYAQSASDYRCAGLANRPDHRDLGSVLNKMGRPCIRYRPS